MLSRVALFLGWEAHGSRIITASFKTKKKNIMMNAPTNDIDEETKDQIYSRLQSILDKCREKDVTILIGDFEAKIGMDNNGFEKMIGDPWFWRDEQEWRQTCGHVVTEQHCHRGSIFTHTMIHKTT